MCLLLLLWCVFVVVDVVVVCESVFVVRVGLHAGIDVVARAVCSCARL